MRTTTDAPLAVRMVVSEAVPFAKTGGLADVSSALAKALARAGHDVVIVLPKYRGIGEVGPIGARHRLTLGDRAFDVGFIDHRVERGFHVIFVECDELYDRDGLYGSGNQDHPDNATRFGLLARAALEDAVIRGRRCDLVHAHDWQAGLVPAYLRTRFAGHETLRDVPVMFTVHNIGYQGTFPEDVLGDLDLDRALFTADGLEFWGQVSFLKAGLNLSDVITTVSRGHAREILTPEFGFGFDGVVRGRQDRLLGIRNGIDVDVWNPETDPLIPTAFSADDLTGKRVAKHALLDRFRLSTGSQGPADRGRPVVGMVSRLVDQKGFDLLAEIMDELATLGARIVLLGTGEPRFEEMWRAAARDHPKVFGVRIGYDEELAHLIEAGADLFLMPSRYEPCGLNQMYSMRYGTVPMVRATGGLDDAVTAYDHTTGRGTGFKFSALDSAALLATVREALTVFEDEPKWRALQRQGMSKDFSWTASAAEYVKAYRALVARRRDRRDERNGNGRKGEVDA